MHNLRHFYYQNKEKIWKVILVVALILGVIYLLNSSALKRNNAKLTSTSNNSTYHYNETNETYILGSSAVSGESITNKEASKVNETISKFLQYCKNGKIEEAYSMLSEDCKNEGYKTIEKFTNGYVNTKFNKNQVYEIQKWERNTFKVNISEDMLATGQTNNTKTVEYITIVTQDGTDKLNINGYIGRQDINKEKVESNVRIKVIDKHEYMDYEVYNFEIENLSNKTIKLDSLENTGTVYLKDSSENKYKAYLHELLEEEVTLDTKRTTNLSIKFANTYSDTRIIKSITFENLILDYYEYKKVENKDSFDEICKFVIDL